jgi:hypothetical protein
MSAARSRSSLPETFERSETVFNAGKAARSAITSSRSRDAPVAGAALGDDSGGQVCSTRVTRRRIFDERRIGGDPEL